MSFLQIADLNFLVSGLFYRLSTGVPRILVIFGLVELLFASAFLAGFVVFVHFLHDKVREGLTYYAANHAATISLRLQHQTLIDRRIFLRSFNSEIGVFL